MKVNSELRSLVLGSKKGIIYNYDLNKDIIVN